MSKKNKKIQPTEQDIFNYVFFPGKVTPELKEAIEKDRNLDEAIYFYRDMLAESVKAPSESLKQKIAHRIPQYSSEDRIIYLYPFGSVPEKKKNVKRLAAASESRNLISKLMSKTFADENKEFMIKVINYETSTKVFVFSSRNDIVKNFDIIVEPHNIRYHFDDSSQPLQIDRVVEIESIRLEFEKGK